MTTNFKFTNNYYYSKKKTLKYNFKNSFSKIN